MQNFNAKRLYGLVRLSVTLCISIPVEGNQLGEANVIGSIAMGMSEAIYLIHNASG